MTIETLHFVLTIALYVGGLTAGGAFSLLYYIKHPDVSTEDISLYFIVGVISMFPVTIYLSCWVGSFKP